MNESPSIEIIDALNNALAESQLLGRVLADDVARHVEMSITKDLRAAYEAEANTESSLMRARRDYVRAVFAQIEAQCFSLKDLASSSLLRMSDYDRMLCKELDLEISNNGSVRTKKRKISFIPNLRYSFDVFARQFGVVNICDYGAHGFEQLRVAVAVRDRLTHPKHTNHLLVTIDELSSVSTGYDWFVRNFYAVTTGGLDAYIAELRRHFDPAKPS